jgi:hypothetical protein
MNIQGQIKIKNYTGAGFMHGMILVLLKSKTQNMQSSGTVWWFCTARVRLKKPQKKRKLGRNPNQKPKEKIKIEKMQHS